MKRTLLIMALVFVFLLATTTAFAAGQWHYCDLCGREHSGVRCPEACQNDCSLNAAGSVHKWYDCPERTVTACWYCGDESGNHNENTCPNGGIIWNDIKGSFRAIEYSGEDGTRLPQYCDYCEHYGYHSSEECLSNPNRLIVVITTPEPKLTNEPVVTPKPTACQHTNFYIDKSVVSHQEKTPDYCEVTVYWNQAVCSDCGYRGDDYETVEKVEHTMRNGKCTVCGYEDSNYKCTHQDVSEYSVGTAVYENGGDVCNIKYDVEIWCNLCGERVSKETRVKPQDHIMENGKCIYCGKQEMNDTSGVCNHKKITDYRLGNFWYESQGDKCMRFCNRKVVCDRCQYVVKEYVRSEEVQHDVQNGTCVKCGSVFETTPTSVIEQTEFVPTATSIIPIIEQNQSVIVNNETTWWQIVLVIIAFVLLMVVICKAYKAHEQVKRSNSHTDNDYSSEEPVETSFTDDDEEESEE